MSSDRLYDLTRSVLQQIETRWPADCEPLPGRRILYTGAAADIPQDEPQLAVSYARSFTTAGSPAIEQYVSRSEDVWYIQAALIEVELLRPVRTFEQRGDQIRTPKPAALEAETKMILADQVAIFDCIVAAREEKQLAGGSAVAFESWAPINAADLRGGTLGVRIGLI